jgi:hypothetical protein
MLAAAVAVGAASLGAAPAQAAGFGFHMRGPVAYLPPCPGAGYVWVAGYMNNGYWVPGFWNFVGVRGQVARFGVGFDRHFDGRFDHGYARFRR